jgi:hypothetical protein
MVRKIGPPGVLAAALLASLVGCESTRTFLDMKPWQIQGCNWSCVEEAWAASQETPTVEASLERVNTAARLVELGELMLQGLPLSAGSLWPQEMRGTLTLNAQSFTRILQENYRQRVLYAAGLGFQPSPWTGRALELQQRLFSTPPDLHYERTYRSKAPSEDEVHALAEKVLGPGYDRASDKNFFGFFDIIRVSSRNERSSPRSSTARRPSSIRMSWMPCGSWQITTTISSNSGKPFWTGEEVCERAYRDVEESARRIRELKSHTFGNPTTPEEAAQKGEESAPAKELQELEAQFDTEKTEYEATVKAYQSSLQQLSVAVGQIKNQSAAFTVEQRALAINVQAVVDTAQSLLAGTRLLMVITTVHAPKAALGFRNELLRIAATGGDRAVPRMKRIVVNSSLLKPNLSLIATESSVLDAESKPYDDLFEKRINAPTIAAP